jgi:hypothetical protein
MKSSNFKPNNNYKTPFDKMFDLNRDGKMSSFEKGMRDSFIINSINEMDKHNE